MGESLKSSVSREMNVALWTPTIPQAIHYHFIMPILVNAFVNAHGVATDVTSAIASRTGHLDSGCFDNPMKKNFTSSKVITEKLHTN